MFIAQCNDVYLNPNSYKDKLIKVEGMFDCYKDEETQKEYCGVIRNGPGCCGNDGVAGFEFEYSGDIPEQNDWIEVIGKVTMINDEDGNEYLVLEATSVKVLSVRGAEYVSQ